jgi:hypothetical protein
MNGLHVEGMAQDEGNLLLGAQVRQPIPGEHALGRDDQPFAVRANQRQKAVGMGVDVLVNLGLARLVHNADVHASRVQIDAAVEFVLLLVESHRGLPGRWMQWSPQPAPQPHAACQRALWASLVLLGNAASD